MTKQHVIGHYLDGRVQVAFCKVCSAEGDKLLEDCPQEISIKIYTDPDKINDGFDLTPNDKLTK